MLKQDHRLERQFWKAIGAGVIVFFIFLIALSIPWRPHFANSSGVWDAKVTDLALALFTYCLVVVGWATMRSNSETTEILERAYVGLLPANFTLETIIKQSEITPNKIPDRPNLTLQLQNSGRSGAIITELRAAHVLAYVMPDRPPYLATPKIDIADCIIAASHFSESEQMWMDKLPTAADITAMRGNSGNAFFYGIVRYTDVFAKERVTAWCMRSDATGKYRYWGNADYNYQI